MATQVVGISDLKVAKAPDILVTYALGSCVGICLFDSTAQVGGLAHIMLPASSISPGDPNIMKFADTAIPKLVDQMLALGADRKRMVAKLAGGAQMFGGQRISNDPFWQIGKRNVIASITALNQLGIRVVAQDVLLTHGRTVHFDTATGAMEIHALGKPPQQF